MKGLSACLDDDLEPVDWLRILNRKVFFWPDTKQLKRLTGARMNRSRERSVLVVDTRSILNAHFEDTYLCPINSGNSMRRPARRGLATFSRAADYEWDEWRRLRGRTDSVVEIAIDYRVGITDSSLVDVRRA